MAVASVFILHGINTASGFVSPVTQGRVAGGIEIQTGYPAGHPQPLFKAVRGQQAEFAFSSPQIATVLGITGLLGYDGASSNTDLYFRAATEHGSRTSGASSAHQRYRASHAFMVWESITAEHQGEASISGRVLCGYDGSNEPIVPAGSQALAGTPSAAEYFGAGPVVVNGTTINGVQSIQVDLGLELYVLGGESEPWPTFFGVQSINPRITIRALDHTWATFGLDGTAITSLSVFLRRKAANGVNVANGTSSHVKFSATSGIVYQEESTGGNNDPGECSLVCELVAASDTGNALTVATAQTIS